MVNSPSPLSVVQLSSLPHSQIIRLFPRVWSPRLSSCPPAPIFGVPPKLIASSRLGGLRLASQLDLGLALRRFTLGRSGRRWRPQQHSIFCQSPFRFQILLDKISFVAYVMRVFLIY